MVEFTVTSGIFKALFSGGPFVLSTIAVGVVVACGIIGVLAGAFMPFAFATPCANDEQSLREELAAAGISIKVLATEVHPLWFRGDWCVLPLISFGTLAVILFSRTDLSPRGAPFLLAAVPILAAICLPWALSYFSGLPSTEDKSVDVRKFFAARACQLAMPINMVFAGPILFCVTLTAVATMSVDDLFWKTQAAVTQDPLWSGATGSILFEVANTHASVESLLADPLMLTSWMREVNVLAVTRFGGMQINSTATVMLGFLLLVVGIPALGVNWLLRSVNDWFDLWDAWPHEALTLELVAASPFTASRALILSAVGTLVVSAVINVAGVLAIVVTVLWLGSSDGNAGSLGIEFALPSFWYRAVLEALVGSSDAGYLAGWLIGIIFCAPATVWLTMWVVACCQDWRMIALLLARKVQRVPTEVAGVDGPRLLLEKGFGKWPESKMLLPVLAWTVVCASGGLLAELGDRKARVVLAHEVGHALLHLRLLWMLQALSRLSLCGPSLLTVLVDYRRIELEADEFALNSTTDPDALVSVLTDLPSLDLRAELQSINLPVETERLAATERLRQIGRLPAITLVKGLYFFYFGSALWGYFHPSLSDRLANVQEWRERWALRVAAGQALN